MSSSRTISSGPRRRAEGSPASTLRSSTASSPPTLACSAANTSGDVGLGSHRWPCAIAHTAGRRMTNSVSEPGSITIRSVSSPEAASAVRTPSAGTGRAAASHRCIAATDENTGSTRRPSGAATVTIDSSCVLSTASPCAPDALVALLGDERDQQPRRAVGVDDGDLRGGVVAGRGQRREQRRVGGAVVARVRVGLEAAPLPRNARGVVAVRVSVRRHPAPRRA